MWLDLNDDLIAHIVGFESFLTWTLCATFHLAGSLSTGFTGVLSLSSPLTECVCVCVSHRRGLSAKFPQNLSLALWFKAGQLIQGRTEGEKECEEEEEWPTEGEKVGRMPDSIESLCTVFEVRGWGFRGKQDYSESIPSNNPGVWASARKQYSQTDCGYFFCHVLQVLYQTCWLTQWFSNLAAIVLKYRNYMTFWSVYVFSFVTASFARRLMPLVQ